MAKKGITPMKPPKSPMASGKTQDPNISATNGHKAGKMGAPTAKSSGSGSNKAGGGRNSGAAKAL
jgi:hypothetical protein